MFFVQSRLRSVALRRVRPFTSSTAVYLLSVWVVRGSGNLSPFEQSAIGMHRQIKTNRDVITVESLTFLEHTGKVKSDGSGVLCVSTGANIYLVEGSILITCLGCERQWRLQTILTLGGWKMQIRVDPSTLGLRREKPLHWNDIV
jgi:hypothetical protein